jgi:hypothetical protein
MESANLECALTTAELESRPAKAPRLAEENRALRDLAKCFAAGSPELLQLLADLAMELCHADSAGISIKEWSDDGTPVFRWVATAGAAKAWSNQTIPCSKSPCGIVLDRNCALLFDRPDLFFPDLRVDPRIIEGLLIPWTVDEATKGTIWALSHREDKKFDKEDLRLMNSLADIAGAVIRGRGMEEALRKQEVSDSAWRMANRLAHEINNPLQALSCTLHLMAEEARPELNDTAHLQLDRIASLVNAILALKIAEK